MIDLTRNRRKIFAFTGLFVLLLAAVLLLLPPEISPALGGGVGLEYRIHAVFNDEEERQLAESSLIQTASDTLGLPVEGSLVPSSAQENLWLLQLRLDPTDEIPYDDFQDLTYALINSFPGWTFQTTAGISQSRGTAVRSTVDYLPDRPAGHLGAVSASALPPAPELPCRRCRNARHPVQPAGNVRALCSGRRGIRLQHHSGSPLAGGLCGL